MASDDEASHWPRGTASTQPRQISARNALAHSVNARLAALHGALREGLKVGAVLDATRVVDEHGATLCSHDNDFSRFPGLRWEDPLQA